MRDKTTIFVSYSHKDEQWRKRFVTISKPLSRSEKVTFWSDRDMKPGEWEPQIKQAIQEAIVAVLLVSDNFLESDFIVETELPYLLQENRQRGLQIVWAYLQPCDIDRHPEIKRFQAMSLGDLVPLSALREWEWREVMLRGCHMIDDCLKEYERPVLNGTLNGRSLPRISENVQILASPARRRVEVLVYAGKWWRQACINEGAKTISRIYLGDDKTKKGTEFPVVALTCQRALANQTYLNLPEYRTKSELMLKRG